MQSSVLHLKGLQAWYDESHVLHGVDLVVNKGEIVTLLGKNGAGKTTTLKAIAGMMQKCTGEIFFDGVSVLSLKSHLIARLGIGYVPEDRGIFHTLSVAENLELPPAWGTPLFTASEIYDLFPNLKARKNSSGGKLSGGEQQMLAIGRVLRAGPSLLLLDEPTEGLAPVIVEQIGELIRLANTRGVTILMVEQNFDFSKELSDRFYLMETGIIKASLSIEELNAQSGFVEEFLGV